MILDRRKAAAQRRGPGRASRETASFAEIRYYGTGQGYASMPLVFCWP
jgi:hypothetical protein